MSGIQQRIADILRQHLLESCSESWPGHSSFWGRCRACGYESERRKRHGPEWELNLRDDECRHVAEVLVSELGLDEATVNPWTGQPL